MCVLSEFVNGYLTPNTLGIFLSIGTRLGI